MLIAAAQAAAAGQQHPGGALYVVATPIGNLADLTLRAIHLLALADLVACEDTRVAGGLLRHLGLVKPMLALHEHNEQQSAVRVLVHLARGERVVCISDAGTPAVSDPGARLVAAARAAGHRVLPIPGPSSVLAALSAAGDVQPGGFAFSGFLPARGAARTQALRAVVAANVTQVLFEAPHRIEALAAELAAGLSAELSAGLSSHAPARRVTLCRELTKQFEHIVTMDAAALPAWLAADPNHRRGEFVLVLHGQPAAAGADDEAATRTLTVLLRELPLKQAVALAAEITGAPRNALYPQALALRGADTGSDTGSDSAEA